MQKPSTPTTRYSAVKRPAQLDGYTQRIPMWDVVDCLGSANRSELLYELRIRNYERPKGAELNEAYCRVELTDMTKRGFLKRVQD